MSPILLASLFFSLLFFVALPCNAEISATQIQTDARNLIVFDTFGFNDAGRIRINVSDVKVWTHSKEKADKKRMGFLVSTVESELEISNYLNQGKCVLDSPQVIRLFTLYDVEAETDKSGMFSYLYNVPDPREYSVVFANCQSHAVVSMEVRLALYNLESDGRPDFLSAGRTQLPNIYVVFSIAFLLAAAVWAFTVYSQYASAHQIHVWMGVLVIVKALTLLSQAGEYAYIKSTGVPHGWNIVFYVFSFFRGVMLFTIIVLIGTGWSFLKPFLQDRDKKIILIVVPLQVCANLATVILDETSVASRDWMVWLQIFYVLDIVCCCAVLFPIVWSIRYLREASHTDGKAARTLVKLTLFRQFYVVVVCYIYFTRIIVYLLNSTLPFHYAYWATVAREAVSLAFYCFVGYKFRPVAQNPYLAIDEEEEMAAVEALKDDEFDL